MKVIDLLNKIVNKENVPKKIGYNGFYFNWTGSNYYCGYEDMFLEKIICIEDLEYPIEIIIEGDKKEGFVSHNHRFIQNENGVSIFPIEEDKEIEKITKRTNKVLKRELIYKINELVEAVNELKKGK